MKIFLISVLCLITLCNATDYDWPPGNNSHINFGKCVFPKHNYISLHIMRALKRITPLVGKRFSTPGHSTGRQQYGVGVCTVASVILSRSTIAHHKVDSQNKLYHVAGALTWNQHAPHVEPTVIGLLNTTEVTAGSDWVSLTYDNGEIYKRKCSNEARRTVLVIKCNPREYKGQLRMIENNFNKTSDCSFLFELEHHSICPDIPPVLSPGSIICIVFFGSAFLYLLIGFFVQRFIMKKVGAEQVPNYNFWRSFGHLQGDGCDLICRCGGYPGRPDYDAVNIVPEAQTTPEEGEGKTPIENSY